MLVDIYLENALLCLRDKIFTNDTVKTSDYPSDSVFGCKREKAQVEIS